ncbi:hypothetical protein LBMAG47_13560 [Planctomycetia bacterium]|jgi:hypothetical protein|nr:hypothetical protein LBMAG47_13560 [Planctomycetia bacterium]
MRRGRFDAWFEHVLVGERIAAAKNRAAKRAKAFGRRRRPRQSTHDLLHAWCSSAVPVGSMTGNAGQPTPVDEGGTMASGFRLPSSRPVAVDRSYAAQAVQGGPGSGPSSIGPSCPRSRAYP